MKVCFHDSSRTPGRPEISVVEMPQCPAVGDSVFLTEDAAGFTVKTVLWTPYLKEYDVQVRGW